MVSRLIFNNPNLDIEKFAFFLAELVKICALLLSPVPNYFTIAIISTVINALF